MGRGQSVAHSGILVSFLLCVLVLAFLIVMTGSPDIPDDASRNDLTRRLDADINMLIASESLAEPKLRLVRELWWSLRSDPPLKTEKESRESDMNVMPSLRIQNAEDKRELAKAMEKVLEPPAERLHIPLMLSPNDAYDLYRLECLREMFTAAGRWSLALEILIKRTKRDIWSRVFA